jgi:S1-C subfamily serine protease
MNLFSNRISTAVAVLLLSAAQTVAEPSWTTRTATLQSVVLVNAANCLDGQQRIGSGFTVGSQGRVITAHHVVGGCQEITVEYAGVPQGQARMRDARVVRVLARRDLALLEVSNAPAVPILQSAPPPPEFGKRHAGSGFQNGQPSPGDIVISFTPGGTRLRDVLPNELARTLKQESSAIDLDQDVLRFNSPLQPGMSGGPIIDDAGRVVGVVAGGLRSGAAPASWGWPISSLPELFASTEAANQRAQASRLFYSRSAIEERGRALSENRVIKCGDLDLTYVGRSNFVEMISTADDQHRLGYLVALSTRPIQEIHRLSFQIWTHKESGATAVIPDFVRLQAYSDSCRAETPDRNFRMVVWATKANSPPDIQAKSVTYELTVAAPRFEAAIQNSFVPDQALTTLAANGLPGPQVLPTGMIYRRLGGLYQRQDPTPGRLAHMFQTLAARNGALLAVTVGNSVIPDNFLQCQQSNGVFPGCQSNAAYVLRWAHFVLATQLSTFSSN